MANVDFSIFFRVADLDPGHQEVWSMTRSDWTESSSGNRFQINVSAHPLILVFLGGPNQLMVTDVRSNLSAHGAGRVLNFTVRNTGPQRVSGYVVTFSFVTG